MLVQTRSSCLSAFKRVALAVRDINFLIRRRKNAAAPKSRTQSLPATKDNEKNGTSVQPKWRPVTLPAFRGKVSTVDGNVSQHGRTCSFFNNKRIVYLKIYSSCIKLIS